MLRRPTGAEDGCGKAASCATAAKIRAESFVTTLVLLLDLAGTFVFALSGATVGVRHKLDIFGVLVLSYVAANAGGIGRDLLLGVTPPAAIRDWRYASVSFLAGLLTFYGHRLLNRLRSPVLVLDAAGLSLFAVAGSLKALTFHLDPVAAVALGVLTAVGGGVVRDVLVAEVPTVLHSELYAVAALIGATVVVVGQRLHLPPAAVSVAGGGLCFALRMLAIRRGWQLPIAGTRLPPGGAGP
jgi:uncharacterized membrane protein YeiH